MNKRATRYLILVLFWLSPAVFVAQETPTATQIRQILQERIDKNKKSVGIVVGLIDKNGSHVVGYGKLSQKKNKSRMATRFMKSVPSPKFLLPFYCRAWPSAAR